MIDFKIVIPARFASTRLPGKPLRELAGQPMIAHVVARARASSASRVIVATDDQRIVAACAERGIEVLLTAASHRSGTDRVAEVIERCGWAAEQIVVNVQGDEPCLPPELIDQVAANLAATPAAALATLAVPLHDRASLFDPNVVKVVTDARGLAQYFSRAPLPWHRDDFAAAPATAPLPAATPFLRHIGLYAYRAGFLQQFVTWAPAPLEEAEALEQLRALWHGAAIHVGIARVAPGCGVDTAADLAAAEHLLRTRGA
jgi:3-deoxy-manno-octulosonate cytidylyltransferase (CMP-KDO synthetase)